MNSQIINSKSKIDMKKVKIIRVSNYKVMCNNLDTDVFSNGEPIPEAKTSEDWNQACRNQKPAWCFIKNKNFNKLIKLYNWYAVNDPRGICPEGFRIPSSEEIKELFNLENIQFSTKFSISIFKIFKRLFQGKSKITLSPLGYRSSNGDFTNNKTISAFWSSSNYDKNNAYCCFCYHSYKEFAHIPYAKDAGFLVRGIQTK